MLALDTTTASLYASSTSAPAPTLPPAPARGSVHLDPLNNVLPAHLASHHIRTNAVLAACVQDGVLPLLLDADLLPCQYDQVVPVVEHRVLGHQPVVHIDEQVDPVAVVALARGDETLFRARHDAAAAVSLSSPAATALLAARCSASAAASASSSKPSSDVTVSAGMR